MIRSFLRPVLLSAALSICLSAPLAASESNARPMIFGGGTPFGYYFGLAGAACRAVNEKSVNGFRCLNVASGSSAANLERINDGSLDFAVVQSDWLRHAAEGTSRYRSVGPNDELRSIISVPAETLTILARREVGATVLTHLSGRSIGYDVANRYGYLLMQRATEAARVDVDWRPREEAQEKSLKAQICAGDVDAIVTVERHPSGQVSNLIHQCDLNLVSIDPGTVEAAIKENPELMPHRIAANFYAGSLPAIDGIGLAATVVTQSSASAEHIEILLRSLFEESVDRSPFGANVLPGLRRRIEMAARLAPLHESAKTFFKSKGWLP